MCGSFGSFEGRPSLDFRLDVGVAATGTLVLLTAAAGGALSPYLGGDGSICTTEMSEWRGASPGSMAALGLCVRTFEPISMGSSSSSSSGAGAIFGGDGGGDGGASTAPDGGLGVAISVRTISVAILASCSSTRCLLMKFLRPISEKASAMALIDDATKTTPKKPNTIVNSRISWRSDGMSPYPTVVMVTMAK